MSDELAELLQREHLTEGEIATALHLATQEGIKVEVVRIPLNGKNLHEPERVIYRNFDVEEW